eukprot:5823260-Alexandrium_andersonii.AAC.1
MLVLWLRESIQREVNDAMRKPGTAAKQVARQANYSVLLEEIAGDAQPSSTPPASAASPAAADRVSALLEGTGPQPFGGGPPKSGRPVRCSRGFRPQARGPA